MSQRFKTADFIKRFAAWILDNLLILVMVVACCVSLSDLVGYEEASQSLDAVFSLYEAEYGVSFDMTEEEYLAMTEAERLNYDQAYTALSNDPEARQGFSRVTWLTLIIAAGAILLPLLVWEFLLPLCLGSGQTLGKKVFSLAVVRKDFRDVRPMELFLRTFVGKYLIETLIPVVVVLLVFLGAAPVNTALLLAALGLAQLAVLLMDHRKAGIHGLLSGTIVVDKGSLVIVAE